MSVQLYDMILKNTTSSGITIYDLSGLYIPASGTRDITDLFPFQRLIYSLDLEAAVISSGIVVNVEGYDLEAERAQTFLSHHDATHIQGIPIGTTGTTSASNIAGDRFVKFKKSAGKFELEDSGLLELSDTPTTYVGADGLYLRATTTGVIFDSVDHGDLDGLVDDDHLQYVPRDGSRGFTSTVSGISAVEPKDLVTYDQLTSLSDSLSAADNWVTLIRYTEDDTISSTTSTTFQTKIQFTIPATVSGTIRIMWSMEYNADGNNRYVVVRTYNLTDAVVLGENFQQTNNNENWWTFAGFGYVEMSDSAKTFQVQYAAGTAGCSVRNAHLEACRITLEIE